MGSSFRIGPADLDDALRTGRSVERSGRVDPVRVIDTVLDETSDVVAEAVLEPSGGDVTARVRIRAAWSAPCRRCAEPIAGTVEAGVVEVFARSHTEGETYPFDGDELDLTELVRDAVALELPLAPLPPVDELDRCRVCGLGPEQARGDVDGDADEGTDDEGRDPRWAALDELRDELD